MSWPLASFTPSCHGSRRLATWSASARRLAYLLPSSLWVWQFSYLLVGRSDIARPDGVSFCKRRASERWPGNGSALGFKPMGLRIGCWLTRWFASKCLTGKSVYWVSGDLRNNYYLLGNFSLSSFLSKLASSVCWQESSNHHHSFGSPGMPSPVAHQVERPGPCKAQLQEFAKAGRSESFH